MAEVDYGYGDVDYGYGDSAPATDYGYGDAAPSDQPDYGYGDAAPVEQMDYGYGDAAPEEAPPKDRRPKRRCSVTKFSLATETPLTAASVINDLRMGVTADQQQPPADDCKSAVTDETGSMDLDQDLTKAAEEEPRKADAAAGKKQGMMSRIRRRLSIAM
jgi:hypothetical protein